MKAIKKVQSVLFAEPDAGSNRQGFYSACVDLANNAMLPVMGAFNGTGVMVEPGSKVEALLRRWDDVRKKG